MHRPHERPLERLLPRTHIDSDIPLSLIRCCLFVVSVTLLATDIPRAGLGLTGLLDSRFPTIEPNRVIYFGPYEYAVIHVNRTQRDEYVGSAASFEDKAVPEDQVLSARVWTYKFDTTSIVLRGLMQVLHLTEDDIPRCLLEYDVACDRSEFSLQEIFAILDVLLGRLAARAAERHVKPFKLAFETQYLWRDRLHHLLARALLQLPEQRWRYHSVHWFFADAQQSLPRVCGQPKNRPLLCDETSIHQCTFRGQQMRVAEQLDRRLATLRSRYPSLRLEVAVAFTTEQTTRRVPFAVSHLHRMTETNVLVRGRDSANRTVFVDDYRYERSMLETSTAEWESTTAALRTLAQGYVWLRLLFLCVGCFLARKSEPGYDELGQWDLIRLCALTLIKIPGHVVVYGSVFPIACYVLAHFIDCNVIHLIVDITWASINGIYELDLKKYLVMATIQLRCTWILALLLQTMVALRTLRRSGWSPSRGVLGVRGLSVSFITAITVWAPYRSVRFRDSRIITLRPETNYGRRVELSRLYSAKSYHNHSLEGPRLDAIVLTLGIAAFVLLIGAVKLRDRAVFGSLHHQDIFLCHSLSVSWGAGSFWPTTALSAPWTAPGRNPNTSMITLAGPRLTHLFRELFGAHQSVVHPLSLPANVSTGRQQGRSMVRRVSNVIRDSWSAAPLHRVFSSDELSALVVHKRTQSIHSLLRLMNMVLMTDPFTLLWLRGFDRVMFVYHVRTESSSTICLLPDRLDEVDSDGILHGSHDACSLFSVCSSREISWNVLLQCG
ncbi:hypothetical protein PINS_up007741 [Pythium insidiosum]|nr:hypothetical protein PINS_up007741 [Pythium insidiosum]